MYNLNNDLVIKNLQTDPHIYVMKDGTFEFEDEQGVLSDNHYPSYVEAKRAFIKYADLLFGITEDPKDSDIRARRETSRRLELASVLRGLRTTINMLIWSTDNFKFHQNNDNALHAASVISDNMAEYADLLDPVVPF